MIARIIDREPSPYHIKTYDDYIVCLHPEDLKMLTLKQLYSKAMKNNYETAELGKLAAHVAFENRSFSKKLAKRILIGINKSNGDDIQPSLDLLEYILSLNDSLKQERYEWFLGIPYLKLERPSSY
jgi:hypothetical protein